MACDIPPLKIKETRGNALAHPQSHGLGLKMSNEVLLLNHHIKKVKPCLCDYTVTMELETIPLATGFETSICFFQQELSITIIDILCLLSFRGEGFGTFSLHQRA